MIVPIRPPRRERKLGFLKGKGRLLTGWDKPIEDFANYQ